MTPRPRSDESAFTSTERIMQTFRMPRELVTFLKDEATAAGATSPDTSFAGSRASAPGSGCRGRDGAARGRPGGAGTRTLRYVLHVLFQRSLELREKGPGFDAPSTGKDRKKK